MHTKYKYTHTHTLQSSNMCITPDINLSKFYLIILYKIKQTLKGQYDKDNEQIYITFPTKHSLSVYDDISNYNYQVQKDVQCSNGWRDDLPSVSSGN